MPTSNWVFQYLLILAIIIPFSCILFFIVRRFIHYNVLKKHHDLVGYIIATLGTLYSVFLGFTIVNSQEQQGKIISKVNQEAYLCADLLRMTELFPNTIRKEMQDGILTYLQSVIDEEWPLMAQKLESPYTLRALETLWKPYYEFEPKTTQQKLWFATSLDILLKFNSARLQRVYSSWESLGPISWTALLVGAIIISSFLFYFGSENPLAHLSINSLFIAYIVFMIFVVYLFDNPFKGFTKIQPKAYKIVYNYYTTDQGTLVSPETHY